MQDSNATIEHSAEHNNPECHHSFGLTTDSLMSSTTRTTTKEDREHINKLMDPRWCENGKDRYGEFGVIGAEQADESHLDTRRREEADDDEEEEDGGNGLQTRIQFSSSKLFGREEELKTLLTLYQSMVDENKKEGTPTAKTVFLSGYSGCGKSALVNHLVDQAQKEQRKAEEQVLFLRAKYEATSNSTSSAPFSAFSTLFDHLPLQVRQELRVTVYPTLFEALGEDVIILFKIFPQLKYWFGEGSATRSMASSRDISEDDSVPPERLPSSRALSCPSSRAFASDSSMRSVGMRRLGQIPKSRLKIAISALFRALCGTNATTSTKPRPLILFVDDLQWADLSGLELIHDLITDDSLESLFFIGAYRSNQVDDQHPLTTTIIEKLEDSSVPVEVMPLSPLNQQALGEFIADSLQLSSEEVQPLTEAIFTKTLGNPLYCRQALEHLVRQNALYYDNIMFAWAWNLKTTNFENLLSQIDIVEMVQSKIQTLSKELQHALAVASHVRATFDVDTLCHVMAMMKEKMIPKGKNKNEETKNQEMSQEMNITHHPREEEKEELVQLLDQAVEEGLLLLPSASNHHNREYAFIHDRIQEASTTLLQDDKDKNKISFVRLGHALLRRARSPEHGEDWMYFTAARHLNNSTSTGCENNNPTTSYSKDKTIQLAQLNLHTAELSMGMLAFQNAIEYVQYGITNVSQLFDHDEDRMWEEEYNLLFDLYSVGAQALAGSGNMFGAEIYCTKVLERKKNIYHALPVYKVYLDVVGGKGKIRQALELSLSILEELGVSVKTTSFVPGLKIFGVSGSLKSWLKLRKFKANYIPTEESVKDMPYVTDPIVADTMALIKKAAHFAFTTSAELYMNLSIESIKWMSLHGLTETSGASVASLANVFMHKFGDFEIGTRLADLALAVVDRQKNKYHETQALNTANMNVLGWVRPIKSRVPYHIRAYESGIVSGNSEGAAVGKMFSCWALYHSASPLSSLEEDCRKAIHKLKKQGFHYIADLMCILRQLVLNLMGESENTVLLIGQAMDQNSESFQKFRNQVMLGAFKSYAMVSFCDFEAGAEDALERGHVFNEKLTGMQYGLEPFYRGISLYAMARKTGLKKYKTPALQVREQYQDWVAKGCVNHAGLLLLLDAEHKALSGKSTKARKYYEDAIATLAEGGFYNNAGLACERYGSYLAEIGEAGGLRSQLLAAIENYTRWGAKKKVEILGSQLDSLKE